ncbi:hypothetical protein VTK73DRAFT_1951 [Phialemonium thermophilum]|uniref:Uncharacterized protein n=1 Tax=Phialemonium thermophilum TaxID=223376 RepID=A0ABR3X7H2_9PEZI
MSPSAKEKYSYSPDIPSPLNPVSGNQLPLDGTRCSRGGSKTTHRAGASLSPTQRLLRYKAAEAWKSETAQRQWHQRQNPGVLAADHGQEGRGYSDAEIRRVLEGWLDETLIRHDDPQQRTEPYADLESNAGLLANDLSLDEKQDGPASAGLHTESVTTRATASAAVSERGRRAWAVVWRVGLVVGLVGAFTVISALPRRPVLSAPPIVP